MEVDSKIVENVARIARLKITEEEIEKLIPEMEEILEFFNKISKIDVPDEEIRLHPIEVKNVMRKDIVKKSLEEGDVFRNVKNKKESYIEGPNI